ncbi:MAG: hypothetical protein MUE69_06010 [Myxococcota bacterium]|nr:hypothetical protein [Myxococcota bacterium]
MSFFRRVPHRVTFLPTVVPVVPDALRYPASFLVNAAIFESLVRHPHVAMTDRDDFQLLDEQGRLVDAGHPDVRSVIAYELYENRRDEVLAIELSTDGKSARLTSHRHGKPSDTFEGAGAIAAIAIDEALARWLRARGLGAMPHPLEPFDVEVLRAVAEHAAREVATDRARPEGQRGGLSAPAKLVIPFCHFASVELGYDLAHVMLGADPSCAWGLRDDHLRRWHQQAPDGKGGTRPGASRDDIRRALGLAPCWGKLHALMWGDDVPLEEERYHASIAATLLSSNGITLTKYAWALQKWGRFEEGHRWASKAARLFPAYVDAHLAAMDTVRDLGRDGRALADVQQRLALLGELQQRGRFGGAEPALCLARLRLADSFLDVGRLEDATFVRQRALELVFNRDQWPKMTELLRKWQTEPGVLALAYAREGFHRGEPGRAILGLTRAPIEHWSELVKLLESLLAVGRRQEALACWHHHRRLRFAYADLAQLAGARVMLANGRADEAIRTLAITPLRAPTRRTEAEVNRLLRVAAAFGPEPFERQIAEAERLGAKRLAAAVRRDASDFVPSFRAAPTLPSISFRADALAKLHARLSRDGSLDAIDALFGQLRDDNQASADALVNGWVEAAGVRTVDVDVPDGAAFAGRTMWLLAGALCRYLALTTQPANALAGALRTVATEALALMEDRGVRYDDETLRGLFEALEAHASVEPAIFDRWLLRVERALELDRRKGGHLEIAIEGLPRVAHYLRGDETVAFELRLASDLAKEGQRPAALELYERSFHALGAEAVKAWMELAATGGAAGNDDEAIDVAWLAFHTFPRNAAPAVELAKRLWARGLRGEAFGVLGERLGWAGNDWRRARLTELSTLTQGAWPAPMLDFQSCAARGVEAAQRGDWATARTLWTWADVLDPGNAEILRNLGLAAAKLGDAEGALACFGEQDLAQGPVHAAQQLLHAGHPAAAAFVYRYLCVAPRDPVLYLQWASAAYLAEDDAGTCEAYALAERFGGPAVIDGAMLNAWAGSADNVGDVEACERVARRLIAEFSNDPLLHACGLHHLACALLQSGKAAEGLGYAQQALQRNPEPANVAVFQETFARCQQNLPREPSPSFHTSFAGRAFAKLEAGDAEGALAVCTESAAAGQQSWLVMQAALRANERRPESTTPVAEAPHLGGAAPDAGASKWGRDTAPPAESASTSAAEPMPGVMPQALALAGRIASWSVGAIDPDALFCRERALRVRENACFPIDPPPLLGKRMTEAAFAAEYERRGGLPFVPRPSAMASADADPEVLPGTQLPRLSDYVGFMKLLQTGDMNGAMKRYGLDMGSYAQLSQTWSQKMQQDPALMSAFQRRMQG